MVRSRTLSEFHAIELPALRDFRVAEIGLIFYHWSKQMKLKLIRKKPVAKPIAATQAV